MRKISSMVVGVAIVGGTIAVGGVAYAGYESSNVGTTDSNTRVEGQLRTTGATSAWIYGECDWSPGNIETARVKHATNFTYVKSSQTCFYGVQGGAQAAGIG